MPRSKSLPPTLAAWADSSETLVSKAELAGDLGVTAGRISHFVGRGLPVRQDGLVPLAEACDWLLAHLDPLQARETRENARGLRRAAYVAAETLATLRAAAEIVAAEAAAAARRAGLPESAAAGLADAALREALPALNALLGEAGAMRLPVPPPGAWRRAAGLGPEGAADLLYLPRPPVDPDLEPLMRLTAADLAG